MKKWICLIAALAMVFSLAACAAKTDDADATDLPEVSATAGHPAVGLSCGTDCRGPKSGPRNDGGSGHSVSRDWPRSKSRALVSSTVRWWSMAKIRMLSRVKRG